MAAKQQGSDYTSRQIQVLKGLEAVRKRPGMYIGSTSARGLHHLVYEVVDNSIDEAMAGHCTEVHVTIHPGDSITVVDDGRGIPVDIHPTEKVPGVELAMTTLHAGGKFDKSSYKVSGGLHGVGVSVVNALSEWLEVEVRRGGKRYHQRYGRGVKVKELEEIGSARGSGTQVSFKPDHEIFTELGYSFDTLSARLRELAFLNKGLKIVLRDERTDEEVEDVYKYDGGLAEFVRYLRGSRQAVHDKVVYFDTSRPEAEIELAMQYDMGFSENTHTFVNNINTHEGGTHLTGFKAALTRTINDYARKNNIFKKDESLSGDDVREGLTCVLSVKVMEPQFEGQTKTKLGNSEVRGGGRGRRQRAPGHLPRRKPQGRKGSHREVPPGRPGPGGGPEGAGPGPEEECPRGGRPSREAGRLLHQRPGTVRDLPGGGRQRRRLGEAGQGPVLPGHPSPQGEDPQRRKGADRQDPLE